MARSRICLIVLLMFLATLLMSCEQADECQAVGYGIRDDRCDDITLWIDGDAVNGVSQENPAGQFEYLNNPAAGGSNAARSLYTKKNIRNRFTLSVRLYHDLIGGASDPFLVQVWSGVVILNMNFQSDGLFIHDGASSNEAGTNLVQQQVWQEWKFEVTATDPALSTVDIYLDGILVVDNFDCSQTSTALAGYLNTGQRGDTINGETHMDYIKVGNGLGPSQTQVILDNKIAR